MLCRLGMLWGLALVQPGLTADAAVCTGTSTNTPAVLKKVAAPRPSAAPIHPPHQMRVATQTCIDEENKLNFHVWVNPHAELKLPLTIETKVEGDCTAPDLIVLCDADQTVHLDKFLINGTEFTPEDGFARIARTDLPRRHPHMCVACAGVPSSPRRLRPGSTCRRS